jgi:hypothetical protein
MVSTASGVGSHMEDWPAGEGVAGRVKRVQIDGLAGRGRGYF